MKCVIIQPSYIPWRGYFDQIRLADIFIFYDNVQYDKHGWRNRNRIKTHQGPIWLTIPVHAKGAPVQGTPINEVEIDWRRPWSEKHWATLQQAYGKAPYFKDYASLLEEFYARRDRTLADFTMDLTIALSRRMGFATQFLRSSALPASGDKNERLIQMLSQVGCTEYISGPSARGYMDEALFGQAGISIRYMEYDYPAYPQLYPPYDPQVSILDLLFMTGPQVLRYFDQVACENQGPSDAA